MTKQRFSYTQSPQLPVGMPLVNIQLSNNSKSVVATALVDSGAALNILPFDIGVELGLEWEKQTYPLDLGGVLQDSQAYATLLEAKVAELHTVQLAFAWINKSSAEIRLLLGQVNFFQEFNVHFYGNEQFFEVEAKRS